MVISTYRKHGIRITHIWFPNIDYIKENKFISESTDILFFHGLKEPISTSAKIYKRKQKTIIKDISLPVDSLFLSLGKHLRQYIKRSTKENIVKIRVYSGEQVLERLELINEIACLYEKMFSDKGLKTSFNKPLFLEYAKANVLMLGVAYKNEVTVGFSAVIHDDNQSRLWLTAFDFRNGSADSQVLSRAHQRLDWEIILQLKALGIMSLDFGGVNSFDNPDGISKFKMNFEKENRTEYINQLIPNSILGKMILKSKFVKF